MQKLREEEAARLEKMRLESEIFEKESAVKLAEELAKLKEDRHMQDENVNIKELQALHLHKL